MPKASRAIAGLPPAVERLLKSLASDLKIARLRRHISIRDMAERLYVSPTTVTRMESADPTIRLGIFLTAAWVLGFDRKLEAVFDALKDETGARLSIAELPKRSDAGVPRGPSKSKRQPK